MKIFVLFGQRKGRYDGDYWPIPLAVAGEHAHNENPAFLEGMKRERENESGGELLSFAIIPIELPIVEITRRLNPKYETVKGIVVEAD
jgi:hypothetical protein